ncbi:MAG TPA: YlmC/YmxH family sporulation protein [Firmicutes bacterium]|uniref:YlmC/YmxH family sporulation protein n=1 Tax=Candidatus Fermentithermobacillus carboniphilus TaxID=3085328 RepID=A0AAT9LE58_9FIRM|nr:MAG: YlmC/YmxH family sporulation protein [Candidatus Fermentithermobacillus carboniphilus]HHW17705.1 YlmC/YmxH family sporulation protein [Candidatus Fermentithermobacillaceae bacterium]
MIRASDLAMREVINTTDGRRLGNIVDVELDLSTGKILAVVVPGQAKAFGIFGRGDDYVIPWENIKKIGEDVILVELSDRYMRRSTR